MLLPSHARKARASWADEDTGRHAIRIRRWHAGELAFLARQTDAYALQVVSFFGGFSQIAPEHFPVVDPCEVAHGHRFIFIKSRVQSAPTRTEHRSSFRVAR